MDIVVEQDGISSPYFLLLHFLELSDFDGGPCHLRVQLQFLEIEAEFVRAYFLLSFVAQIPLCFLLVSVLIEVSFIIARFPDLLVLLVSLLQFFIVVGRQEELLLGVEHTTQVAIQRLRNPVVQVFLGDGVVVDGEYLLGGEWQVDIGEGLGLWESVQG